MNVEEVPLVFECQGVPLIGIAHVPETPGRVGLLTLAAGGVQYRAGSGRQLVILARALAAAGTPVMRFDHRGHGDSAGEPLGFEHMEYDLERAIEVFREQVPGIEHLVLYGGCEGASAIMMNAWRWPEVKSVILANPWVDGGRAKAVATRKHFQKRLFDASFWRKFFSGQYNLMEYAASFATHVKKRLTETRTKPAQQPEAAAQDHFVERMRDGFQRFNGRTLLLKSGRSMLSDEFDVLVASAKAWRQACARDSVSRLVLPEADQTFSTEVSRQQLCKAALDWVAKMGR